MQFGAAIYDAIQSNNSAALTSLLKNHLHEYGEKMNEVLTTFLKTSIPVDSPNLVSTLFDFGADINAPVGSNDPEGVIELTCLGGPVKLNAARRLLELGAKINFDTPNGVRCRTLIFAISKGSLEMVKLLIQYGAAFNSPERGLTALDHATTRGQSEIAEYLRSIGGKTAKEMGWIPPPPAPEPELTQVMNEFFEAEFVSPPMATIQGLLDSDPSIAIHVIDDGYQYILQTEGIASTPIPVEPGDEEYQFIEIELILPCDWPVGEELLKTDENAWPVTWLRRLAMHPHQSAIPITKLFFYPNGSPPKPFASNTELSVWMLMQAPREPLYISDDKQIVIFRAVPLYKEEYDLVQKHGLGELGKRFDENKIQPHQIFVRKNVGLV